MKKKTVDSAETRDLFERFLRAQLADGSLVLTDAQVEAVTTTFDEAVLDVSDLDREDHRDTWDDDDDDPRAPLADGTYFADPGGDSALRASGPGNPRNLSCPTCRRPNVLTPADRARGYQCDVCADRAESGWQE